MRQVPDVALERAVAELQDLDDRVPGRPGKIELHVGERCARVLLCNPRAHNALTVGMMRQLAEAVLRLHFFEGSTIVVASGHRGSFCAGGHLAQVLESLLLPDNAATMTRCMATVLDALLALPAVSVAVLEGPAIGGGAELATACDLRVARPGARVHFAQAALGVAAGWGGAARLVQHVGRATAIQLLASAAPVSADRAQQLGLVQYVGEGTVDELVRAVLGDVAFTGSIDAVRAVKRQVHGATDAQVQQEAFLSVWGSPQHRDAFSR